jgi:large repetitive protein
MCDNSSTVSLDSFVTGTPGGSWSGTGVSGNLFNPSGLSGSYQVTYTAGIPPCQASETHVIQVIGSASAEWNAPAWFCANHLPVQLSGTVSGTTGGTWSGPGITNTVNGTFNPASAGAGSHVITYAVSGMCGDTVSYTIAVFPVPSFTITSAGESCAGAADGSAALQVAGGNPPYSYSWSNQSTSPSVNLLAPGDYTFTITDANLCSVSGLLTIPFSVEDCVPTDIFVPNIFSPDGNDLNDVLYVRGPAIVTMKFLIYNRWGQKVFESHHINHGWNGTYKGINAETGVYTWMLEAQLINGRKVVSSGNVTLVR